MQYRVVTRKLSDQTEVRISTKYELTGQVSWGLIAQCYMIEMMGIREWVIKMEIISKAGNSSLMFLFKRDQKCFSPTISFLRENYLKKVESALKFSRK